MLLLPLLAAIVGAEQVQSSNHPDHALNINDPSSLGIDTVKQYAGYLDVNQGQDHLFFWFFESRNDPQNDPTVLWLNGGPGCSSIGSGLLFENGPSSIVKADNGSYSTKFNDFSWNSNANMLYLDQPVNTGYSYSANNVTTSAAASKDVIAFLDLFFTRYPEYAQQKFHISGESYGGHYIPVLASDIIHRQVQNPDEKYPFELESILIGNGLTDPLTQYKYYQPMACGDGGYKAILNATTCKTMNDSIPACESRIAKCYDNPSNTSACIDAQDVCDLSQLEPIYDDGWNPYDVREKCPEGSDLCYPGMDVAAEYLNQTSVKEALGVPEWKDFESCNNTVNAQFGNAGDWMLPIQRNIEFLLKHRVPVLIYAGDKDFICNWLGNRAWTKEIDWPGADKFKAAEARPWNSTIGTAGEVTNWDVFTFLRVYNAGHMVPFDQPENALDMLNKWVQGDYSF